VTVAEQGKLVAVRFLDRRLLKGWTFDFRPNRDFFHLREEGTETQTRVPIKDLKAIFFIKTLGRDPSCVDKRAFEERVGSEKKVWIEFSDGEKMAGWSNSFGSPRGGFYVFPADPDSNMEKAYVFRSALRRMEEGEAAEQASRSFQTSPQESSPQKSAPSTPHTEAPAEAGVGVYRMSRTDLQSGGQSGCSS
jgi:hypothetical protein